MKLHKKGSILFISMTGLLGVPYVTAYAAVKSAMHGIVQVDGGALIDFKL